MAGLALGAVTLEGAGNPCRTHPCRALTCCFLYGAIGANGQRYGRRRPYRATQLPKCHISVWRSHCLSPLAGESRLAASAERGGFQSGSRSLVLAGSLAHPLSARAAHESALSRRGREGAGCCRDARNPPRRFGALRSSLCPSWRGARDTGSLAAPAAVWSKRRTTPIGYSPRGGRRLGVPRAVFLGLLPAAPGGHSLVLLHWRAHRPHPIPLVRTGRGHQGSPGAPAGGSRTTGLGPPSEECESSSGHRTSDPQPERLMTAPSVTESTDTQPRLGIYVKDYFQELGLRPHPEERCAASRLEGWAADSELVAHPSRRAFGPPQDEDGGWGNSVMPGLGPGIHAFTAPPRMPHTRGWQGRALP